MASCPVPNNRQSGQQCGGPFVGTCVSGKCQCSSGYTGPDCSQCDPTFFSVQAPEWGASASKCSLTDSSTSFVGLSPTPTSPNSMSPSDEESTLDKLTKPLYLGIGGGAFLLILLLMFLVICYIRRCRGGRKSAPNPKEYAMANRVNVSTDDNESVYSVGSTPGTTPYASRGHQDSFSLASSGKTASKPPSDFRPQRGYGSGRGPPIDVDRSYSRGSGRSNWNASVNYLQGTSNQGYNPSPRQHSSRSMGGGAYSSGYEAGYR